MSIDNITDVAPLVLVSTGLFLQSFFPLLAVVVLGVLVETFERPTFLLVEVLAAIFNVEATLTLSLVRDNSLAAIFLLKDFPLVDNNDDKDSFDDSSPASDALPCLTAKASISMLFALVEDALVNEDELESSDNEEDELSLVFLRFSYSSARG